MISRLFLALTALTSVSLSPAYAEAVMMLKGRVLNPEHHPVAGAKIFVHDEETGADARGDSDRKGHFSIKHSECNYFSFDVVPPANSGLSRAHFQHVSGEAGKHFIVQLHRGFVVSGRVVANGAPVKGIRVKITANEPNMTTAEAVHGGGHATTGKNGEFMLTITPGQKIIEVLNDKYADLAKTIKQQVSVSGDTQLPEIVLPVREKS
jgi:uncharacterized GH25 family protein